MAMNLGYIELGGGGVAIRVHYDMAFEPVGDQQPLVDGPRGWCLDVTNTSGRNVQLVINGIKGNPLNVTVPQGNPVTSGAARSRTAAQLAALEFTTRGDLGQITIS